MPFPPSVEIRPGQVHKFSKEQQMIITCHERLEHFVLTETEKLVHHI